jgi:uncharacterized protein (DUF433 family)
VYDRILSDPAILGGKPCVKGTRISVEHILELIASGASRADIVAAHPRLTEADVEQAVRFATDSMRHDVLITASVRD